MSGENERGGSVSGQRDRETDRGGVGKGRRGKKGKKGKV